MEGREAGDDDADVLFEQGPEGHASALPWAKEQRVSIGGKQVLHYDFGGKKKGGEAFDDR